MLDLQSWLKNRIKLKCSADFNWTLMLTTKASFASAVANPRAAHIDPDMGVHVEDMDVLVDRHARLVLDRLQLRQEVDERDLLGLRVGLCHRCHVLKKEHSWQALRNKFDYGAGLSPTP